MNISALSSSYSTYGSNLAGAGMRADKKESGGQGELSEADRQTVEKLKARDREVRQHEQAHQSAAGGLAVSGATYTYQKGPDGKDYAIGGEVGISMSPGKTPEETIQRARQVQAAALAPASPSGQDRAVASQAAAMAQQAEAEKAANPSEENPAAGGVDRSAAVNAAYGEKKEPSGNTGSRIEAYA